MIIKVAVKKDNDKITWRDPYSGAIRNRLRVDLNLADIPDKEAARNNLGLGSVIEDIANKCATKEELRNEVNNLKALINSSVAQHNSDITSLNKRVSDLETSLTSALEKKINEAIARINELTNGFSSKLGSYDIFPVGTIVPFCGNPGNVPYKWHICDGTEGTIDLRNRFPLGTNDTSVIGHQGGEWNHVLSIGEMPSHSHKNRYFDEIGFDATNGGGGEPIKQRLAMGDNRPYHELIWPSDSADVGGNQPHNNMPPYSYVFYIQKIRA